MVPTDGLYEITLANCERARARKVVVAVGVEHFAYACPTQLAGLPSSVCTHSSAHTDLAVFRDQEVIVVGAGQSALESAALLHENGADVQLVARAARLAWNGAAAAAGPSAAAAAAGARGRPRLRLGHLVLLHAIRSCSGTCPKAPGSPGPGPRSARPAHAGCASRVEGKFPVLPGHALEWAQAERRRRPARTRRAGRNRPASWPPTT